MTTKTMLQKCLSIEDAQAIHENDTDVLSISTKLKAEGNPFLVIMVAPACDGDSFGIVIQTQFVNVTAEELKASVMDPAGDTNDKAAAYVLAATTRGAQITATALNRAIQTGDDTMAGMILDFVKELDQYIEAVSE